jgi:hypothetical protein
MLHRFLHTLINHFVPHDGNNYAPHLLRRAATVGMFGLVLLSFTAANLQALLWQQSDWLVGAILPAVVVQLTNEERVENDAPLLVRSSVLDAAATLKAEDMAQNGYFSHDSPTGVTPWHWFEMVNYSFTHAGENLAVYFTDSGEVVDAWMNSPGHRANIVDGDYREIGIGTARGTYNGYDTVYVVQLFGTPAAAIQPPTPAVVIAEQPTEPEVVLPTLATTSVDGEVVEVSEVADATEVVDNVTLDQTPLVAGETTRENIADSNPVVPVETLIATPTPTPTETIAVTEPEIVPERIIDPQVAENYQSLYSGLAASSTTLIPAPIVLADVNGGTTAPMMARIATEPNKTLQMMYIIIGLFVSLALILSVILEWRQHRPMQTVYGITLLIIMCSLFLIHTMITGGAVIS